jgi:hypothetical protein
MANGLSYNYSIGTEALLIKPAINQKYNTLHLLFETTANKTIQKVNVNAYKNNQNDIKRETSMH